MSLSRQLAFSFLFFFSDIFNSFTLFPLIANSTGMFVHFYFLCSNKLYWLVWRPRNLLLREIRLSNIFNSFSTLFLTSVPLSITFIIAERGIKVLFNTLFKLILAQITTLCQLILTIKLKLLHFFYIM